MMGGIFSKSNESAAKKETVKENGVDVVYITYRGQASKEFQEDFYGTISKTIF
jgi:hypothetical protein